MGRADAVRVRSTVLPAGTRIRGHHQLESRREVCDRIGSVDAHHPRLEWLAQRVESRRLKLGSLIEEQDPVRRAHGGPWPNNPAPAPDERCRRGSVMRGFEGWPHGETGANWQPGQRADRTHFDCVLGAEVGEKTRQPGGEHGLACARRAEQENMVPARRSNSEGLNGILVAHNV